MAAYAALLSLMHTIKDIHNHPCPPISLNQKHRQSLTKNLTFLQHFLELHSNQQYDLERRIAGAAHAAEDVIETHIVDQIEAGSTSHDGKTITPVNFYGDLERAIQDLDLIKKEAEEIEVEAKDKGSQHQHHLHTNSSATPAASTWQSSTMVHFDDVLVLEVLDKLVGQQSSLQIIPIVGMGGIGKTTLARNIYTNPLIVEHFDILAWVIVSQECSVPRFLLQVLGKENQGSEDELGLKVYQELWDRRYLIVMDDIWSSEVWEKVKSFFPNNNNGSRIMITTRQSNLAFEMSGSHGFRMNFLNEDKSWDLLRQVVFGKESQCCPVELEDTGKAIARNCRGLPLSIVVIGGVLKRSNMTSEYWEYTLENLNSLINLDGDEYCLQLLHTSYKELPVHLKPCFLYMGIFPEDSEIKVSDVIKMWIAEAMVKPIDEKSLEEAAEEYVKELLDRNLVLVNRLKWNGRVKSCRIHDVLRDVCIREAQKQRFYRVISKKNEIAEDINMEKRICFSNICSPQVLAALKSKSPVARSLFQMDETDESLCSRVLRFRYEVGRWGEIDFLGLNPDADHLRQINLRCISQDFTLEDSSAFSQFPLLWNLQTLAIIGDLSLWPLHSSFEIWKMPLLRHAKFRYHVQLSDPRTISCFMLEHLQTLSGVLDFECDEETAKRIPNINTLKVKYENNRVLPAQINLCLNNLHKLEILTITKVSKTVVNVTYPHSLKKLTLSGTRLSSEELTTKIGSLPLLQFLKIGRDSFTGSTWDVGEARFCSLKHLEIANWSDLEYWTTDGDGTPYPCLEKLLLKYLEQLEEIPSIIGDAPTLKSIELLFCSESAKESAKRIQEEQQDCGNEDLQLIII